MFFSAKYRKVPRGGSGKQHQPDKFVLETPASAQQMTASTVKFDAKSPAAIAFKDALFEKIKEIWDSSLTDDAVAQYTLALVARGTERKKLEASLKGILGAETAKDVCDWVNAYVRRHREALAASQPKASKKHADAAPSADAAAAPAHEEPAPATAPEQQRRAMHDDVAELLAEDDPADETKVGGPAQNRAATATATATAAPSSSGAVGADTSPASEAGAAPRQLSAGDDVAATGGQPSAHGTGRARLQWVEPEAPKDARVRSVHSSSSGGAGGRGTGGTVAPPDGRDRSRRSVGDDDKQGKGWGGDAPPGGGGEAGGGPARRGGVAPAPGPPPRSRLRSEVVGRDGVAMPRSGGGKLLRASLLDALAEGARGGRAGRAAGLAGSRGGAAVARGNGGRSRSRSRSRERSRSRDRRAVDDVAGYGQGHGREEGGEDAHARGELSKRSVFDRLSNPDPVKARPKRAAEPSDVDAASPSKQARTDGRAGGRGTHAVVHAAATGAQGATPGRGTPAAGRGHGPGPRAKPAAAAPPVIKVVVVPDQPAVAAAAPVPVAARTPAVPSASQTPAAAAAAAQRPVATAAAVPPAAAAAAAQPELSAAAKLKAAIQAKEAEVARLKAADVDARSVVVTNVDWGASDSEVASTFAGAGEVRRVLLVRDPATGRPTGQATVEFAERASVHAALKLGGSKLRERSIAVVEKRRVGNLGALAGAGRGGRSMAPGHGRSSAGRGGQLPGRGPGVLAATHGAQ